MISMTLPEPPSLNTYWKKYRNRMVLSEAGKAYKYTACLEGKRQKMQPLRGPIAVTVRWYRSRKAGDLDNRLKALFDALEDVAFTNDNQVTEIHASRHDTDPKHPRVEISISPLSAASTP